MPDRNARIILQLVDQLSPGVLGAVGGVEGLTTALGVAQVAVGTLKAAFDLAEEGAKVQRTAKAFDGLAESAGASGDILTAALRKASGGEVSDLNLQLAATKAEFTGVATSAEDFSRLMAIARNNGREFGISTEEAFNRLTDALDRGQARGLKQIGINVDLKEAERTYAASIGVTVASLDEEQKRQALVQAALVQGEAQLQRTGGAANDNAAAFDRAGAAASNTKNAVTTFLAGGLAPLADKFATTVEKTQELVGWIKQLGTTVPGADTALAAFDAEMARSGDTTKAEAAYQAALAAALQQTTAAMNPAPIASSADAQRAYADSLELTGVRARAAALAADQKSTSDKVAAIDAQTHAIAQNELAEKAQLAADALIKAGPAGARTAAILAQSSSDVDILTAAYYRLAAAQPQKQSDLSAGLSALRSGSVRTANEISDANTSVLQKQADANVAAQKKAADDAKRLSDLQNQDKLIHATTTAAKIAELERQKAAATTPIERQQLQNQIDQERIAAEKASGRTRVSAAQSTALQLQNVEENSGLQLLKIQRENNERLRDAQQDFDLKRSRSKEDEDAKIESLLAHGQRAQADRERADFAKQQKRDQEDFNIARQRTIRNNNEATGDLGNRTALRTDQIQDRAALRGVRPGAVASGGAVATADTAPASARGPQPIAQLTIQGVLNIDSKAAGTALFPTIEVLMDESLAISLRQIGVPNAGQLGVAGSG